MKKWQILVIGLTLALATAGSVAAFAFTGDGSDAAEPDPAGGPANDQPPIRADEGIDPNECNLVHNITACDDQPPESGSDIPADSASLGDAIGEPAAGPAPDYPTASVLAPIESVKVLIAESYPPQYGIVVVSGLPNSCVSFGGYEVKRDGSTIRITVTNMEPAADSIACAQLYGTVEHTFWLGSDFEPGETYTVVVNEVTESFVAQ